MTTEADILRLLERRFTTNRGNGPGYVFAPHVKDAAGWDACRTADLVVMELWPSMGLHLHGFEIKTTRSDWLRELREPQKSQPFLAILDTWSIVAPKGTVLRSELDERFGLLEAQENRLRQIRAPTPLRKLTSDMAHLSRSTLAALLRSSTVWAQRRQTCELPPDGNRANLVVGMDDPGVDVPEK